MNLDLPPAVIQLMRVGPSTDWPNVSVEELLATQGWQVANPAEDGRRIKAGPVGGLLTDVRNGFQAVLLDALVEWPAESLGEDVLYRTFGVAFIQARDFARALWGDPSSLSLREWEEIELVVGEFSHSQSCLWRRDGWIGMVGVQHEDSGLPFRLVVGVIVRR